MIDKSEISAAFDAVLRKYGFSLDNEILSFVRHRDNGQRDHVEVEAPSYVNGIGVTLQSFNAQGTLRRETLERFRGVRYYTYDPASSASMEAGVALALSDMLQYGIPWFDGKEIRTAAVDARQRIVSEKNYRTSTSLARDEFKRENYFRAKELFDEAAAIRPLDPLDERFRKFAIEKIDEHGI